MDTIGTRTFTTIHMPGIHMHIIPLPQATGTADIGPTTITIAVSITPVIEIMISRGLIARSSSRPGGL